MAAEAVSGVEARLEALVDTASLRPLRSAVGDGVIAGSGTIDGAPVFCWAQDGRFRGGSLGVAGGETIARVLVLTGPGVVREVTREEVEALDLGGPRVQGANGVVHLQGAGEADAAHLARRFLTALRPAPARPPEPGDPGAVLPVSPRAVYDVR